MSRESARTAILIGNGAFPQAEGVLQPLSAPRHDVAVLAGVLTDPELCKFAEPRRLVDSDARTIKKALLRTLEAAGPHDLVLIYYAGHGKLDGAQLYLCTHDTEPEALSATSVSIRDIHHYVSRSTCKQVVLILDCCFSGAAADEFQTRGELADRVETAASARGIYLLASCGAYEPSLEHTGNARGDTPYGVYTRALTDGIVSGRADLYRDGRITPLELARYLQSRVPGQTPRVSLFDAEGDEPVLAWTAWMQSDEQRKRVREKLAQWYADEAIPYEILSQAMDLMARVPQTAIERHRKRLLGLCAAPGWDEVFARAWLSLDAPDDDAERGFERFLTEHGADGTLPPEIYLEAMRLVGAEPDDDFPRRRKRLLARFAASRDRDVSLLVETWKALDRREHPRPPEEPAPAVSEPAGPARAEDVSGPPLSAKLPPPPPPPPPRDPEPVRSVVSPPRQVPAPGPAKSTGGGWWLVAGCGLLLLLMAVVAILGERSENRWRETSAEDTTVVAPIGLDTAATTTDTTRAWDTTAAAPYTDSTATSASIAPAYFSAGLLGVVRQAGYHPGRTLAFTQFDSTQDETYDGTTFIVRDGRATLSQSRAGAAGMRVWNVNHTNVLARTSLRLRDGKSDVGAGLYLRDLLVLVGGPGGANSFTVYQWKDDAWITIQPTFRSDAIRTSGDNLLEVAAMGSTVDVFVNGTYMSRSTVSVSPGTDIRIQVDGSGATYSFDDLVAVELDAGM